MAPEEEKNDEFRQYLIGEHNKAFAELIKLQSFRFYMAELLGFCKTFENAFDEKGNKAAFQNGKQAVGQKIFNDIMASDPMTYVQLCKEEAEHLAMRQMFEKKKQVEENKNA